MAAPTNSSGTRARAFPVQGSTVVASVVLLVCLVLFVWPIVMIVQGAFVEGQPWSRQGWTFRPFLDVFSSTQTWSVFRNSVVLAASVSIPGKFLGFYLAWLVARTDTPLRRFITPTMLAVLALPMLFYAISWSRLGNENAGLLNSIVQSVTGSEGTPINVESFYGLVFVSILKSTALGYFMLFGPMHAMNRALEEAANISGARRLRTFFGVNLPVLAPAFLSAVVLGFILGLEYFDLPFLLGSPAGVDVLSTEIYAFLNDYDRPRYAEASALTICVLVALLVLLVAQHRLTRRRRFETVGGKSTVAEPWKLGRWRFLGTGIFLTYAAFALVLPLFELVRTSLLPYVGANGQYTTSNYSTVLDDPHALTAIRNTALLAGLGGLSVMVLALGIVFVVRRARPRWIGEFISRSTWLPWSAPGTALALGILWIVLSVPSANGLYGGMPLMLFGLIIVAMPLAMRTVESAVTQIGEELEESAWVSGATPLRAYRGVVVRLIMRSFMAGWLLTGILISGNLVMPLMIGSSTLSTVPKLTFDWYSVGRVPVAAAFACMVLAGLLGVYLVGALIRLGLGWRRSSPAKSVRRQTTGQATVTPGAAAEEAGGTLAAIGPLHNRARFRRTLCRQ